MTNFISKLFPKDTPMSLLIKHNNILKEVTEKLDPLVNKYIKNEDIFEIVKFISKKESEADKIKFELRKLFQKKIKTPYAATDMLEMLHKYDFLIDSIEDIAKKMSLNQIDCLDSEVEDYLKDLTHVIMKSLKYLEKMTQKAKKAINSSFAQKYIDDEINETIKIEDLEVKVDKISLKIGKWIYSHKHEHNTLDLIFLKELVMLFVEIADEAENTAELMNAFFK